MGDRKIEDRKVGDQRKNESKDGDFMTVQTKQDFTILGTTIIPFSIGYTSNGKSSIFKINKMGTKIRVNEGHDLQLIFNGETNNSNNERIGIMFLGFPKKFDELVKSQTYGTHIINSTTIPYQGQSEIQVLLHTDSKITLFKGARLEIHKIK
jgi:hypothetical protein